MDCNDCSNSTLCSDCSDRPEAETVLQPSLHTIPEYCNSVLVEAACRGIDISDLNRELDELMATNSEDLYEFSYEIIDDAIGRLFDAGYEVVDCEDTFLIFAKGQGVPKDWTE